ncbi:aldo/keto reductase [Streptomyces sp. NPDC050560]|uniref:aldo/keto reductase n=1 Tax=Streptomyces sp. NPDC050560 TaxID=3365630 RepID=UPI0037AA7877
MRHRVLGATGMQVSTVCLGAMMFGSMGNRDHDDSIRVIHTALDAGVNFIDTADVYSAGESEQIVGKALRGSRRDGVVLATKFSMPMGEDPNSRGGSARWVRRAVEDSLRRLDTDHIDLYQIHRPDYDTDVEETLSALSDLVREGKVRAIGSSTYPAELIVEAQWAAQRGGHRRFTTEQPLYSVLTRSVERAVLPTAHRHGMGVLTYSPLNGGWLSGRADPAGGQRAAGRPTMYDTSIAENRAKAEAVAALREIAAEAGLTLPHLALGFVLAHPAVTSVIIGPRTHEQLVGLLDGGDVELPVDVLDRIDEVVPPGVDVNPADNYKATPPDLTDLALRRRIYGLPLPGRAATAAVAAA